MCHIDWNFNCHFLYFSGMLFNPITQSVILATDQLYSITLVQVGEVSKVVSDKVVSHRQSITTLSYSETFDLVTSTSVGSVNRYMYSMYTIVSGHSCVYCASHRMLKYGISELESVCLSLLQCMEIPVLQLATLIRLDEGKKEREEERE